MLIVKDDEDIHDYVKNYLLEWVYTVIEAGAGGRVRLALDRFILDLVLLEIGLPDLFVLDFVKKIAGEEKYESLKIIALTTADDNESRKRKGVCRLFDEAYYRPRRHPRDDGALPDSRQTVRSMPRITQCARGRLVI